MTSLVRDVMTTEVVTIQPWIPFRGPGPGVAEPSRFRCADLPVDDDA